MTQQDIDERGLDRLTQALASIETPTEAAAFLADLCSVREIADLVQRLEVATMLAEGRSYVDVSNATGASSTTVSRVSKCLNGERGGYRAVLSHLRSEDVEKGL